MIVLRGIAGDFQPLRGNHTPDNDLWSVDGGKGLLQICSGKLRENVTRAVNVLTQRTGWPACDTSVHVDGSLLNDGDYAGICALQGRYGMLAVAKENGKYYLVMKGNPGKANNIMGQTCDKKQSEEYARILLSGMSGTLKVQTCFDDMRDEATFYYLDDTEWKKIGTNQKLYFGLDHFVGCRFGLFVYSTKKIGGKASFRHFVYNQSKPKYIEHSSGAFCS